MGHRQCSCHWYTNIQQWNIRGSRDGKTPAAASAQSPLHRTGQKPTVKPVSTTPTGCVFYQIWQSAWWRYVVRHRSLPAFLPSIAPKPMIRARLPSVPPTPALMEPTTYPAAFACINPTAKRHEDRSDEAVHFEADHPGATTKITPIATMTNGMIYGLSFVMGNVNFLTTNSNYPNRGTEILRHHD